jgi:hypothetical protein
MRLRTESLSGRHTAGTIPSTPFMSAVIHRGMAGEKQQNNAIQSFFGAHCRFRRLLSVVRMGAAPKSGIEFRKEQA